MKLHCVIPVPVVIWSCIAWFQCRWWYEVALCDSSAGGDMKLHCVIPVPEVALRNSSAGGDMKLHCVIPVPVVIWSCIVCFQCRWWYEVALCVSSAGGDMKLHCVIPVPVARGACDATAITACIDNYTTAVSSLAANGTVEAGLCR